MYSVVKGVSRVEAKLQERLLFSKEGPDVICRESHFSDLSKFYSGKFTVYITVRDKYFASTSGESHVLTVLTETLVPLLDHALIQSV